MAPEPPSSNIVVETELNESLGEEKGKETSIIDDRGTDECQEEFDGIPDEKQYNASGLLQNEKPSRPGTQSTKRLAWSIEDPSPQNSRPRYHACDRMILVALCFFCVASVVLTLLMLFGVVGSVNCACTKKTGILQNYLMFMYLILEVAHVPACCSLTLIISRSKREKTLFLHVDTRHVQIF